MAQNGGSVAQPVPHELIKKMSEMLFTVGEPFLLLMSVSSKQQRTFSQAVCSLMQMNGLETALTTADNVSSGSVQQAAVHQSL